MPEDPVPYYGNYPTYRAGGIMQLIANDGNQDRMIMAARLFEKRINAIGDVRTSKNSRSGQDLIHQMSKTKNNHKHFVQPHRIYHRSCNNHKRFVQSHRMYHR